MHVLERHDSLYYIDITMTYEGIREWLKNHKIEGIVWHSYDGKMAKIKRKDFGYEW